MRDEIRYNASGYYDSTAYLAIKKILIEEKMRDNHNTGNEEEADLKINER